MIVGIGVDVVAIERFRGLAERTEGLLERLFGPDELTQRPGDAAGWRRLAAAFGVKEAVLKAIGVPRGFVWHDLVVAQHGPLTVELRGATAAAAERLGVHAWQVDAMRRGGTAIATAIALGDSAPR